MGKYPNNHLTHEDCIFPPYQITVGGKIYQLYLSRFNSLNALYEYLKSDPPTNRMAFHSLASETNDFNHSGKSYREAVEDLVRPFDEEYQEFLSIQKKLGTAKLQKIHKYETVKTVTGGHLIIPDYIAGAPLCYESEERVQKAKFVKVNATLSYHAATTKKQLFNRAIIMANLIQALEKSGYNVDFNTFEFSRHSDELSYTIIKIKKHGGRTNMEALYQTSCQVEFLRRILFRVLETLDVETYWGSTYGSVCSQEFVREALKFDKKDIYFDQPSSMGIQGNDLIGDFNRAMEHLHLDNIVDMERTRDQIEKNYKLLQK